MSLASLLSTVLTASLLAAPTAAADPDEPGGALALVQDTVEQTLGETGEALETLTEVREIFEPEAPQTLQAPGEVEPPNATLALRDLALRLDDLPARQRAEAEAYLARPTQGRNDQHGDGYRTDDVRRECSDAVCVHYVVDTVDAVREPGKDEDGNGVPDYVDLVLATMTEVNDRYLAAGYQEPKRDTRATDNGGDGRPDIYLADIGGEGLFGYCSTDPEAPRARTAWGYCVLDNDYDHRQYRRNTPQQNLEVTAAHEYFHLVQFGYDVTEDNWIMEATATWIEDELFDHVDDNVHYLRAGPMGHPQLPLDTYAGQYHYGTWAFFRFLTERFPHSEGGLPTLVRDVWRRLDARGDDDYSLEAVRKELAERGMSLTQAFGRFSAASRTPGRTYAEARANNYPRAPLRGKARLTRQKPHAGQARLRVDHMSAQTARYVPHKSLHGHRWKLRLRLNLTQRSTRPAALVTVKRKGRAPHTMWVALNRNGKARKTYAFSARTVQWVELTVVNASDRYNCRRGAYSCQGEPRHDNRLFKFVGKAFRR